ncbi:MAG TPA: anti-sigma factor [Acidimicrobiales bacterium]|nr:anti-sigma factor [Acidimicrobiales bacterium]
MSTDFGRGGFAGRSHLGDALSALLDGELSAGQQEAARAHLAACEECTDELSAVGQARSWLRGLPQVDPPFGFYERILLDRPLVVAVPFGARPGLRRRAGIAALAAAAAAVTVLGVGSPAAQPVNPSMPQLVEAHATSASVGADLLSKLAPAGVPVSFGR